MKYSKYTYKKMESKNDFELTSENNQTESFILNGALKTIANSFKNILENENETENKSNQDSEQSLALKHASDKIYLNVRGVKYKISMKRLINLPRSRLARLAKLIQSDENNEKELAKLCDDYNLDQMEFYFDKDPFVLNRILNLYQNGKLHVNHSDCVYFIRDELEYWQIDEYSLDVYYYAFFFLNLK